MQHTFGLAGLVGVDRQLYSDISKMLRDMMSHASQSNEEILSQDDRELRRIGFRTTNGHKIWEISFRDVSMTANLMGRPDLTELVRTPCGRARLAKHITDGTLPDA